MTETYNIAIDFDGTIVEDEYPKIGKPIIFAFDTMKKLQSQGHRLILWTYRKGRALDEAVIEGIRTNRELHLRILQDEDFRGNNYSTNFLTEKMQ